MRARAAGRGAVAAVVLVVLAAPVALAADPHGPALDECDWTSFRNGPRNLGASECEGIGADHVATLVPSVFYRTRDSVTSTPAVADGVLYVGTWDGRVYAFDLPASSPAVGDPSLEGTGVTTVAPRWEYQITDTNAVSFGRIVASPTIVDIAATRVLLIAGGATVYALDASDGRLLAELCLDPRATNRCRGSGEHEIEVESSPVVVEQTSRSARVLIGLDVHNASGIGRTGVVKLRLEQRGPDQWLLEPEWKFDPEAGEAYRGKDLLTTGSGTGGGCGGVWGTPAVDVAADLVVFGTANCSGSSAGPDGVPGTDDDHVRDAGEKVFAIGYRDGALRWRYDPPRPWGVDVDDDFGAAVQLLDVDGDLTVGAAGKDGWYYALHAATGQLTWRTQVGQPGHVTPGLAIGGVLGSPAVGTVDGRQLIFVTTAVSTPVGTPFGAPSPQSVDRTLSEDPGRLLSLHAVDAADGTVVWRQPLTRQTYGHPTYANGLVFVPSTAGASVQAFDAATGVPRWTSPPLNGAPSSGVAITEDGIYVGAGTRQTDLGFKLTGDDSSVPPELQELVPPVLVDLVGSDPQQRASGIWGFEIGG